MKPSKLLSIIVIAAASLWPLASLAQLDRTTTGKSFARRAPESVGIARFAEICPGLSRGGEPNESTLKYLRDHGYKTIVSFLPDPGESSIVVGSGMKYVHIPMHSGPFSADPPTEEQVRQFLTVASDSSQYPMFIHCHAGKDRTGAMSAIYRMQVCGWSRDEAIEEMKAFGFAGRYKKLFNYVYAYSPRKGTNSTELATSAPAPAPAPANSTTGQSAQASSAPAQDAQANP